MKWQLATILLALVVLFSAFDTSAQPPKRQDALWARNISGTITLDGLLTEPEWAMADSIRVQMGNSSGIPGGGWVWENGKKAGNNPWLANTLEWQAPSPPPHGNFAELPRVYRGPYEYSHPDRKDDYWPQNASA